MCGNPLNNCGCTQPCNCPPAPCVEGCLTDTKTDCTFLSEDLNICTNILPKGTTVTDALNSLASAVCNGVVITTQDVKVKVDASDSTNGYLFDKITTCSNLTKTVTNVNGNEKLELCAKLDTVTPGNILTSGLNGLYVPTPNPLGYNLSPLFSTTTLLTIAPILGGQSIKADVKISPNSGNALVDNGGLYVAIPALTGNTTVSATNSNAILTTSTLAGTNYNINSTLKIDPSSTAPISITTNGLKVDCCAPVTNSNTPISVVLGTTSCIAMTATGLDNHTLTPSVVVSPSVGNALLATSNGLYCPTPGSASPTTIQTTPTVIATLVNPTTYSLAVGRSTDSCNGLILGSDNKLYVNDVEEPNSLGFVVDGSDIYFEFQGASTLNTNYEVQVQGTTGSPLLWVAASFDSLTGPVLRYFVSTTSSAATIRARVRYKCGNNYSNWVGITYNPLLVSDDNSITIVPSGSGINNQYSIQLPNPTCVNDFSATLEIIQFGINYFLRVTRTVSSIQNSNIFSLKVSSPSLLNANVGGGTISSEPLVFIPITYIPGNTYQVSVTKHCSYSTTQSNTIVIPITLLPTVCTTDGYIDVPLTFLQLPGFVVSTVPVAASTPTNGSKLKYMITNDLYKNYLEFSGVIRLTSSVSLGAGVIDTGWKTLVDISTFASCTTATPNIYKIGRQEDTSVTGSSLNYDYQADANTSYRSYEYLIRRVGNLIQIRIPLYDGGSSNVLDTYVNLSGLKL